MAGRRIGSQAVSNTEFRRWAGAAAVAAGIAGFLYSIAFVYALAAHASRGFPVLVYSSFQLLGGLLAAVALVGLFERVRAAGDSAAILAVLFGVFAALASVLHAGTDIGNVAHSTQAAVDPSPIDPRGLATFGLAGLALLVFASLMRGSADIPRGLANLGLLSGGLLVVIYFARLVVFTPTNPVVLAVAGLEGLVVNTAWYVWLGLHLRRIE